MPLKSWPAAARSGVAGPARLAPGSAALVLVRALAWQGLAWRGLAWSALAWRALAWRGLAWRALVGGVARWYGNARADRSAGSHGLPRHAFAGRGGVAGRADVTRPRGLARRHRMARPWRLAGSHVVTGRHGRRRLAAGGIGRPAGTARIHAGLVTEDAAAWLRPSRPMAGPGSSRWPTLLAPTLLRLAPLRLAPLRLAPLRLAPLRLALLGLAAVRRPAGFPG